jgi:hypothetical protein
LKSVYEIISIPTALIFSLPRLEVTVMSQSASMAMALSLLVMTMRLLPVLSTISMLSLPERSPRRMTWPLRDLMLRLSLLPLPLSSCGLSYRSTAPTTRMRDAAVLEATSTSSTSGKK